MERPHREVLQLGLPWPETMRATKCPVCKRPAIWSCTERRSRRCDAVRCPMGCTNSTCWCSIDDISCRLGRLLQPELYSTIKDISFPIIVTIKEATNGLTVPADALNDPCVMSEVVRALQDTPYVLQWPSRPRLARLCKPQDSKPPELKRLQVFQTILLEDAQLVAPPPIAALCVHSVAQSPHKAEHGRPFARMLCPYRRRHRNRRALGVPRRRHRGHTVGAEARYRRPRRRARIRSHQRRRLCRRRTAPNEHRSNQSKGGAKAESSRQKDMNLCYVRSAAPAHATSIIHTNACTKMNLEQICDHETMITMYKLESTKPDGRIKACKKGSQIIGHIACMPTSGDDRTLKQGIF